MRSNSCASARNSLPERPRSIAAGVPFDEVHTRALWSAESSSRNDRASASRTSAERARAKACAGSAERICIAIFREDEDGKSREEAHLVVPGTRVTGGNVPRLSRSIPSIVEYRLGFVAHNVQPKRSSMRSIARINLARARRSGSRNALSSPLVRIQRTFGIGYRSVP